MKHPDVPAAKSAPKLDVQCVLHFNEFCEPKLDGQLVKGANPPACKASDGSERETKPRLHFQIL